MQGTHRELFLNNFKALYNFVFSEYAVLLSFYSPKSVPFWLSFPV